MAPDVVSALRTHLSAHFGARDSSSAFVTFLGLEPIEVLRMSGEPLVFVTLGCSLHPMGDPTDMLVDPVRGPRAELVLTVHGSGTSMSGVHRSLAVLAASPAVEGVVLQEDALLDLGEPVWQGAPFTAVVLGSTDVPDLTLDEPADPVRFFEAVPVTATEAAWVRLKGAAALRDAWREAGIDVRDPQRGAATL